MIYDKIEIVENFSLNKKSIKKFASSYKVI